MIFGGPQTIQQYAATRGCRFTAPASARFCWATTWSTIGHEYVDLMVDSVYRNGGRSCINCSSIYASRHTQGNCRRACRAARARSKCLPPDDPQAGLAAFTTPNGAAGDLASDRTRPGRERRGTARHGRLRPAVGRARDVAPTCGRRCWHCDSRRVARRQQGIHVPRGERRALPAGRDARQDRPDAGWHGDHQRRSFPPAT